MYVSVEHSAANMQLVNGFGRCENHFATPVSRRPIPADGLLMAGRSPNGSSNASSGPGPASKNGGSSSANWSATGSSSSSPTSASSGSPSTSSAHGGSSSSRP